MLNLLLRIRVFKDTRGQDLIEYGFVAVAAGAIMPNIANSIQVIFAQVLAYLYCSAGNTSFCPGDSAS